MTVPGAPRVAPPGLRALVALVAVAILVWPSAAPGATAVSEERLRALAAEAQSDPEALAELREVRRVDGARVALGLSLVNAAPQELDARLRLLARSAPAGAETSSAADARDEAESILAEPRFAPPPIPRPFTGVLEAIAGFLEPVFDLVEEFFASLGGGASEILLVFAAIAVIIAAAVLAARSIRRRTRTGLAGGRVPGPEQRPEDPRELERRADEAERRGDASEALRLRFRAGLMRLDAAGAIRLRPSLPTGRVTRTLGSASFASLAADFDSVTYGDRPAVPEDLARARSEWPRVLSEAGRR